MRQNRFCSLLTCFDLFVLIVVAKFTDPANMWFHIFGNKSGTNGVQILSGGIMFDGTVFASPIINYDAFLGWCAGWFCVVTRARIQSVVGNCSHTTWHPENQRHEYL